MSLIRFWQSKDFLITNFTDSPVPNSGDRIVTFETLEDSTVSKNHVATSNVLKQILDDFYQRDCFTAQVSVTNGNQWQIIFRHKANGDVNSSITSGRRESTAEADIDDDVQIVLFKPAKAKAIPPKLKQSASFHSYTATQPVSPPAATTNIWQAAVALWTEDFETSQRDNCADSSKPKQQQQQEDASDDVFREELRQSQQLSLNCTAARPQQEVNPNFERNSIIIPRAESTTSATGSLAVHAESKFFRTSPAIRRSHRTFVPTKKLEVWRQNSTEHRRPRTSARFAAADVVVKSRAHPVETNDLSARRRSKRLLSKEVQTSKM